MSPGLPYVKLLMRSPRPFKTSVPLPISLPYHHGCAYVPPTFQRMGTDAFQPPEKITLLVLCLL
uniref:Uncharacterized protein n=1 Tax=Anguilla anguilla TaxID=7936 RepID=A0A0E9US30_ANGAN